MKLSSIRLWRLYLIGVTCSEFLCYDREYGSESEKEREREIHIETENRKRFSRDSRGPLEMSIKSKCDEENRRVPGRSYRIRSVEISTVTGRRSRNYFIFFLICNSSDSTKAVKCKRREQKSSNLGKFGAFTQSWNLEFHPHVLCFALGNIYILHFKGAQQHFSNLFTVNILLRVAAVNRKLCDTKKSCHFVNSRDNEYEFFFRTSEFAFFLNSTMIGKKIQSTS